MRIQWSIPCQVPCLAPGNAQKMMIPSVDGHTGAVETDSQPIQVGATRQGSSNDRVTCVCVRVRVRVRAPIIKDEKAYSFSTALPSIALRGTRGVLSMGCMGPDEEAVGFSLSLSLYSCLGTLSFFLLPPTALSRNTRLWGQRMKVTQKRRAWSSLFQALLRRQTEAWVSCPRWRL